RLLDVALASAKRGGLVRPAQAGVDLQQPFQHEPNLALIPARRAVVDRERTLVFGFGLGEAAKPEVAIREVGERRGKLGRAGTELPLRKVTRPQRQLGGLGEPALSRQLARLTPEGFELAVHPGRLRGGRCRERQRRRAAQSQDELASSHCFARAPPAFFDYSREKRPTEWGPWSV